MGKSRIKKQVLLVCGSIVAIIVVLIVCLCVLLLVNWTTDEEYIAQMQDAINQEYTQPPVQVNNKITVTQNGQTIAGYKQSYTIESETKAYLEISEVIYINSEAVSSLKEEYVLLDTTIYLHRTSGSNDIKTFKTDGDINNFREIIVGELEGTNIILNQTAFAESELIKGTEISLNAKFSDSAINEMLGTGYKNMSIAATMNKKGQLKKMNISYCSEDENTYVEIDKNIEFTGTVNAPNWINIKLHEEK